LINLHHQLEFHHVDVSGVVKVILDELLLPFLELFTFGNTLELSANAAVSFE